MPSQLERDSSNPSNLIARIDFGVERLGLVHPPRRSKIDSTKQLADNDQIHTTNGVATQGRTIDEGFEDGHRPKIRVIAEQFAQIEQAVFTLLSRRQVIVFGITYSAEKDSRRFQA